MKKILLALFFSLSLEAATYNFPADLPSFGCSLWYSNVYSCSGSLNFTANDIINITSDIGITSGGNFTTGRDVTISTAGNTLNLTLGGNFSTGIGLNAGTCVNVEAGGDITIGRNGVFYGSLQSNFGSIRLGSGTTVSPCSNLTTLTCSPQRGEGTINEIYKVGSTNFFEVKVFDPFTTDFSQWSLYFCDEGAEFSECINFLDVADMRQSNIYWFIEENIPGFDTLNSSSKFTVFLMDGNDEIIDMLILNGGVLGSNTNVNCTLLYDITAETTSKSKGIARNPDGIGDWDDSGGEGSPTESTPGDNNNGIPYGSSFEYRMDECFWDGSADEVIDSSLNGFHGVSANGTTTQIDAAINRSGYFDGIDDHVVQNNIYDALKSTASLSFWIKTDQVGNAVFHQAPGIVGIEDNGGTDDIFWGWIDDTGRIGVQKGNNKGPKSLAPINDNAWHHIVLTRAENGKYCNVYVDGVFNDTNETSPGVVGNTFNRIGSIMDTDGTHTYFKGFVDELKAFPTILSIGEIQGIYTNELAKNNYDGSVRTPVVCAGDVATDVNYTAVDVVGGGCDASKNWMDPLTTKKVNEDISLTVLTRDSSTGDNIEANISKVSMLFYDSGDNSACTGTPIASTLVCTECGISNQKGCLSLTIDKSLNQRAGKCVSLFIEGRAADALDGSALGESNSTDNFSIRPDRYSCDGIAASPLVSEHGYVSSVKAMPVNLTSATLGYTSTSVSMQANKYMRTGDLNISLDGVLSPGSLSFIDGDANATLSFSDVGDIGIDINDSVWTAVDSDDTALADRLIHTECRRLFIPDHFEVQVTRPRLENNASTGFTYLSNLRPGVGMSAHIRNLNVTLTAKGENNTTLRNYKDPSTHFYANAVTISPSITLPDRHSAATKLIDLIDENSTDISGFGFVDGVAMHSYADVGFNYDRDHHIPISPFVVDGNESFFRVYAEDRLYNSVTGVAQSDSDNNVTFFYGRLKTQDLITTLIPSSASMQYEVYDAGSGIYTAGMRQSSINWYINDLHDNSDEGSVYEAIASSNSMIDNVIAGFSFNYNAPSLGKELLDITASPESKATLHLKTQEWLWYVPLGFGSAYDDTAGSDCTMHPCLKFSLIPANSALRIESGDFNGTIVPDENRSDYSKKGVKLFR